MNIHKLFNAGFQRLQNEAAEGGDAGQSGEGQASNEELIPMSKVEALLDERTQGLKSKVDELLTEAKAAKQKAREAEEEKRRLAEKKAQENGDLESLQKSWQEKERQYQEKLTAYQQKEQQFAINSAASKVASSIAEGANAELLSEFVARRLRYEDGEVKVVDDKGNLTVSSLEDLQREFASNPKFASLVKGTGSSGSGATSTKSNGGAGQKTISRDQFDRMSQKERFEFSKSGGKVVD